MTAILAAVFAWLDAIAERIISAAIGAWADDEVAA